jgi:hypothetical protein
MGTGCNGLDAMRKLLFLDFDGVLHPNFSQEAEYFSRVPYLMKALEGFTNDVEVIVSSSWRFHWPPDELLKMLPSSLADLVTGFTPEVEPGRFQRYREIRAYLQSLRSQPKWRALDDVAGEFPRGSSGLIHCDGRIGFEGMVALRLRLWLEAK